ncbi:putative C2H2-type domain-containing protein [Seiridium cardinale]
MQAASNSNEIDSRSRSELANDPVKPNPAEMGVPSSTSGTIFPSYSTPAQAEYYSSREPAGSAELNGSTSIELPAQSRDADHETTLSTTSFSFSTGSSSTMSSTPTNPKRTSIVSPLSTVSEYDSYAAQKERRASPGAVYTEGLTASPITEELPADLWSSAPSLSNSGTYSSSSNSFRPGLLDDFNIDIATMMADEPQFYNAEMHDSQWIAEICPVHPVPEIPGTVAPFQLLRDRAVHRQLAPRQESGDSGVTLVDLNDDEIELGQRTEGTFNEATDNSSASSRPPPLAHAVINGEESLQCPYLGCIKTYGTSPRDAKNYARHWRRNHTGDQEFPCPDCDRVFINRKDNLIKHQRRAHGQLMPILSIKRGMSELDGKETERASIKRSRQTARVRPRTGSRLPK